jgi:hypothetical protein
MQPTLPLLDRIVVAADYDPRGRLEPHDDHDDILDAIRASLAEREKAAHDKALQQQVAPLEPVPVRSRTG